jgi:peptidoglycan/LPS O-acetylase OafA/YrhL
MKKFLQLHKNRVVGLDILRSVAILIVLFAHGSLYLPEELRTLYFKFLLVKIDGVLIFFVLSGFLIGRILFRVLQKSDFTHKDLSNFWIRRWFRTLPNYFLVLIVIIIYSNLVNWHNYETMDRHLLNFFFFTQNFFLPHPLFFQEAWSLSIEEWFYILFPVLVFLAYKTQKNKNKAFLFSIIIFLILPLILRIVKYHLGIGLNNLDEEFRKIIVLRLDSIGYGVLGAFLYSNFKETWDKFSKLFLFIGLILLILQYFNLLAIIYYLPLSFTIDSIIILLFLPFMSNLRSTKIRIFDAIFIFISLVSYSIYLLNMTPIMVFLIPAINKIASDFDILFSYQLNYFFYIFFSIFLSYFLYKYYENPMTNLRDKFSKKETKSL